MKQINNWVRVGGKDIMDAILKSGVPYDGLIVNQMTWVPKWVSVAIQKFKDNGGYSDLTLADFLKKMYDANNRF